MPKISFFIGSMRRGGAERVISVLADHFCRQGWDVEIAVLLENQVGYPLDGRIRIVDLTQKGRSYAGKALKWLKSIRRYVSERKPDRIVSFIGRINVLVITACRGLGIPVIVSERNDPKHDGRGRLMLKLCGACYRKAQTVVYQTEYERSCFKVRKDNGRVIPNPVAVGEEPLPCARPLEVVTAGRLLPQKDQQMLIRAAALLIGEYPDLRLKIYGSGSLKKELEELIRAEGLGIAAELPGNVEDLHRRINGSGIFVLCSQYEGLSNALIEAMTLGLPCISTDYPGADEIIENGRNGLLVPCGDVPALAEAIRTLLDNGALRSSVAEEGRRTAERYRDGEVLKQWEEVIGGAGG